MYGLLRKALFQLDAENAHNLVTSTMNAAGYIPGVSEALQRQYKVENERLHVRLFGCLFENPVGLAPGFDKEIKFVTPAYDLGFGFTEVGTITKDQQDGNEKPRMFRLTKDDALINRMGFNNVGADTAEGRLANTTAPFPVGINIGKSKKTPLDKAPEDYAYSTRKLASYADYLVINVSSPNTPGLRKLQNREHLEEIIDAVVEANTLSIPMLLKYGPDMADPLLLDAVEVAIEKGAAGVIATNTTNSRNGLKSEPYLCIQMGGLSGEPLKIRAEEVTQLIYKETNGQIPIIGVGGIRTAEDAYRRMMMGASLVQGYTGFVFEGPSYAKEINQGLLKIMDQHGVKNITEIVGQAT